MMNSEDLKTLLSKEYRIQYGFEIPYEEGMDKRKMEQMVTNAIERQKIKDGRVFRLTPWKNGYLVTLASDPR